MSTTVNTGFDPDERDEDVLDVFREYSMANPYLIREETGLDKGEVNTALVRLSRNGWVEQVTRGLYRFVGDEREPDAAALSPDDVAEARRELDGLETALERGDRGAIEGRLDSLRGVLDDAA